MATRPRKTKAANEWQTDETKYNTDVELIESMEEMLCMIEIVRRRETIAHSRSERPTLAYAPNVSEGLTFTFWADLHFLKTNGKQLHVFD